MTESETLEAIARELFALPLDEFTANRNARVRELRDAGERELAADLQKLRRPALALWAANQLAQQPDILQAVREATVNAADAQSRGSAADLRDALTRLQRALDAAARAAGEVLGAAGHSATEATTLGVREFVRLAALRGGDDWERLASGALMQEPEPDLGFGAVAAPTSPVESEPEGKTQPKPPAKDRTKDRAKDSARDEARQRRLREARAEAASNERTAEQVTKRAGRLHERADDLAERAREAEDAAVAAEAEAARAREQAEASRSAAEALADDDE